MLLWSKYLVCCDNPGLPTIERCKERGCQLFKDSKILNWRQRCWERDEARALLKVQQAFHKSVFRELPSFAGLTTGQMIDLFMKFVFKQAAVTKTMAVGARRYAEACWPQLYTKRKE